MALWSLIGAAVCFRQLTCTRLFLFRAVLFAILISSAKVFRLAAETCRVSSRDTAGGSNCFSLHKMSGKKRTPSIVKMQERAVQKTSVKDLISKYNTKKTTSSPALRRVRRKGRKGAARRGSKMLAVPTNVSEADPEVSNSKSAKEQAILQKLEQQQRDFEQMLEEQRKEKEALTKRLAEAEAHLHNAASQSEAQARAAEEERARLAELLEQQKLEHQSRVEAATAEEKNIEKSYDTTVQVRRKSAALVGRALLGGALNGLDRVQLETNPDLAASPSPGPPPMPTRPKPQQPESDSSSSSSVSESESDDEDDYDYEDNIEKILAKPIDECTHIEKAARRSALCEDEIPTLISLIPDFNEDPAGLYHFLHAPVPYEQGIVQCELHRKGKCFYMYLSQSDENDTKFLMFAQDRSGFGAVNLMLSMVANGKRNDPSFLGKVRGNVLNTKYVVFDNGEHPTKRSQGEARRELAFVNYTLYNDAPRRMTVVAPRVRDDGSVPQFQQSVDEQDILERKYHENDDVSAAHRLLDCICILCDCWHCCWTVHFHLACVGLNFACVVLY